jgi:hypothetical protein
VNRMQGNADELPQVYQKKFFGKVGEHKFAEEDLLLVISSNGAVGVLKIDSIRIQR